MEEVAARVLEASMDGAISPPCLPHISPISPPYLPYISQASMDGAARRRAVQAELRRWHPDKVIRVRVKG